MIIRYKNKKNKITNVNVNIRKTISKHLLAIILSIFVLFILFFNLIFISCSNNFSENDKLPKVLAAESFLADITLNISKDRLKVESLIPLGLDPHVFEPTPEDIKKISQCDLLIINGGGFEEWLKPLLKDSVKNIKIVEASKGLEFRIETENNNSEHNESEHHTSEHHTSEHAKAGDHESAHNESENEKELSNNFNSHANNENSNSQEKKDIHSEEKNHDEKHSHEHDPHFWLNPYLVITYVNNIRDALIDLDPKAKDFYTKNAQEYIEKLIELDNWIKEEVEKIPKNKRLLVTNHESFGYFADRYGFKIIGTIIPSSSTASSPSAKEVAELIEKIKALNIKAIFLETGSDPKIANQIASETGVEVITKLYTHSLTEPNGDAPTYIDMIKYNTRKIVESLK